MSTCRRHLSRLLGPHQTQTVNSAIFRVGSRHFLHPHPLHSWLHCASSQATSAAQMMQTTHRLQPGILQNCMASLPTHHTQCMVITTLKLYYL